MHGNMNVKFIKKERRLCSTPSRDNRKCNRTVTCTTTDDNMGVDQT